MSPSPNPSGAGVLILAPERDAQLCVRMLAAAGHACHSCTDELDLVARLGTTSGVLLLAEECITDALAARLEDHVARQAPWSDLPILIVARERGPRATLRDFSRLGNVSVLTRPMAMEALASAVAAALRARERQFQMRELLRSERAQARRKDEFLAMLAHELRNPLTPIRYAAHGLQAPGLDLARVTEVASLIDRQAAHMGRLIEQLLDVSRVTRGLIRLNRVPVDLARLVSVSVAAQRDAAAAKGVQLSELTRGAAWVDGDRTRLQQVLDNLIDNAVKFSRPGGTVAVEVDRDAASGEAVVSVSDQGDGIAADVLPFLFEPFTQADKSLDRSRGGLGLGLALVRGLVELHGGSVAASSEGAGRGSTFAVRLPLTRAPADAPEAESRSASPGRALRVLVAEDNADAAESLRMILEFYGYQVGVANTGVGAIEAAHRMRPDAVLCDIGLPGITGYDVARALRADPEHKDALLIAVTGYGSPSDRAAALAAGFDEHFAKPVDPANLITELVRRCAPPAHAADESQPPSG